MKPLIAFLAAFAGIACVGACQELSRAHVVRLMLNTNSTSWRLSIDGAPDDVLSSSDMTNRLGGLHLRQGDLIILGSPPTRKLGPVTKTWAWIAQFCESNKVAMYLFGADESAAAQELFSIPSYHWVAPLENPFDLAHASFFREGKPLGHAQGGFDNMLRDIARTKPKKLFILGSLYDINRSFPPNPSPYEHQRDRLDAVLKTSGTELIEMDVLPGF